MAPTVYILCGLTSLACAWLLFRQFRRTRGGLLFWSTLCFVCLAITNVLLFVDLVLLPNVDMSVLRSAITLMGMLMLLFGLIRQST
jgi:hydrogenase/urease accessory protein HupE